MHLLRLSRTVVGFMAIGVLALLGCGGGGGSSTAMKPNIQHVYVMGDSLADVGTYGYKFTVQNTNNANGYLVWPQLVANALGLDGSAQCNFYTYEASTFNPNNTTGCTNFAIGGGRIFVDANSGGTASPQTIGTQLAQKIAVLGNYTGTDLVLVDGGGNDMADLVIAQLGGMGTLQTFLSQQLDNNTINDSLTQDNTGNAAAVLYMQALATRFYNQIKAQTLDKGAMQVGILNMPDITLTPEFKSVLAFVQTTQDATTSQALQAAIRTWTLAYNNQLKTLIGSDSRVALIDFNADFTQQISNPSNYGLSNALDAACPVVGYTSFDVPNYDFPTCSNTSLDATSGKVAGWWKNYAFSDGFHPTPYGHQLLAATVSRGLVRAGWL